MDQLVTTAACCDMKHENICVKKSNLIHHIQSFPSFSPFNQKQLVIWCLAPFIDKLAIRNRCLSLNTQLYGWFYTVLEERCRSERIEINMNTRWFDLYVIQTKLDEQLFYRPRNPEYLPPFENLQQKMVKDMVKDYCVRWCNTHYHQMAAFKQHTYSNDRYYYTVRPFGFYMMRGFHYLRDFMFDQNDVDEVDISEPRLGKLYCFAFTGLLQLHILMLSVIWCCSRSARLVDSWFLKWENHFHFQRLLTVLAILSIAIAVVAGFFAGVVCASLLNVGITVCLIPVFICDLIVWNTEISPELTFQNCWSGDPGFYWKKIFYSAGETEPIRHWCLQEIITSNLPFIDPLTRINQRLEQQQQQPKNTESAQPASILANTLNKQNNDILHVSDVRILINHEENGEKECSLLTSVEVIGFSPDQVVMI